MSEVAAALRVESNVHYPRINARSDYRNASGNHKPTIKSVRSRDAVVDIRAWRITEAGSNHPQYPPGGMASLTTP